MPLSLFQGQAIQPGADGIYYQLLKIPVNAVDNEMPLLRVRHLSIWMDPALVSTWNAGVAKSFEFGITKFPIGQKPIGFRWGYAASAAFEMDCVREVEVPADFPLIVTDQIAISLFSSGTGVINRVNYQIWFEVVAAASDLEKTLGYIV